MIRWLFLVLIIVNLGIFAWGMQRELRPVEPAPATDPSVPSLVLLSESEAGAEQAATDASVAQMPAFDPDLLPPDRSAEFDSGPEQTEFQNTPPVFPEAASAEDFELPGAGPAAEAVPPEPSEPETLQPDPVGDEASEPAPAAAALEPEAACYSIGPFPQRDEAEGLRAALRADALDASLRQQARQEQKGYWVLIPPMASRAEAVAEVDRIKAKGIADVWRFNRGEMANTISLGLFARRVQAEAHQSDLERKGINSEVRPRYVERTDYYVDIGPSPGEDLERRLAERVDREYPEQTQQSIVCP